MPTHPDAIGYILDFGHAENIPWLEMICDLAASGTTTLSDADLETLVQLFTGHDNYPRQPALPATVAVARATATTSEHLESIGAFNGFKRLGGSLTASFPKRVNIIFGANGSGKSSLCEALQILASSDAPRRPIHNVRNATTTTPSFSFRFTSDTADRIWTISSAYGLHADMLKYFDNEIAIYNIEKPVEPGRIVALSPFKLNIFGTAKNHCGVLRAELQRRQRENVDQLTGVKEQIRARFETYEGTQLADPNRLTTVVLGAEIKLGENYSAKNGLDERIIQKAELEKATSEEGLKLLQGEVAALYALYGEIQPVITASDMLIEIDPATQYVTLQAKESELELLARTLIPSGATLDKLMALIRPANEVCNLHSPKTAECPLCKQSLRENEIELFKKYAELLTGELETDITKLRGRLKKAKESHEVISGSSPDEWAKNSVLASKTIDAIKEAGKGIQVQLATTKIDQSFKDAVSLLRERRDDLVKDMERKRKLIEETGKDRENVLKKLRKISAECQSLLYARDLADNIDLLKRTHLHMQWNDFWNANLPDFTSVLRKITSTAKKAHKELVVGDFKRRLNAEYLALAEKSMSDFGVELKDVGDEGTVTMDPHVSGQKIEAVLSEGEQKIHALALFFAELETCDQQVIVFDDPVSSFDYNYIENYCGRLRDLIQDHPNRQIIALTHNWEFFVQIQHTLNTSKLNQEMAVLVLESCVAIDEYSEDIDNLKSEIDKILTSPDEPTDSQKEEMAGKMRRLVEVIVNTHVFNKQRHQFKQKNQSVSTFEHFTKIVPLLHSEAQKLKDIFAKLSITGHDDPRNAYVNTDKAMFQTRYDEIKSIETEIMKRKQ